jgi:hypothetical protein
MIWTKALGWGCIYNTILVLMAELYNHLPLSLHAAFTIYIFL